MRLQDIKQERIQWEPIWRIIPSVYPPIDLFKRVADPADFAAIIEIEDITNDRLRDQVGELQLVPSEQRVPGPGSSYIMAAFTHLNPDGSRFSDGSYGVFYGAKNLATALAESKYARSKFLSYTNENSIQIDMRVLKANLDAKLHDIRNQQNIHPAIYDPNDYSHSKTFASHLINEGSSGICYNSVRCENQGECAALFQPNVLSNCQADHHLCYVWDGNKIESVYKKSPLR